MVAPFRSVFDQNCLDTHHIDISEYLYIFSIATSDSRVSDFIKSLSVFHTTLSNVDLKLSDTGVKAKILVIIF